MLFSCPNKNVPKNMVKNPMNSVSQARKLIWILSMILLCLCTTDVSRNIFRIFSRVSFSFLQKVFEDVIRVFFYWYNTVEGYLALNLKLSSKLTSACTKTLWNTRCLQLHWTRSKGIPTSWKVSLFLGPSKRLPPFLLHIFQKHCSQFPKISV